MKKTWKRLCTGFLALATVVTALPTTPVHAESKQYWTESAERVGIIEKVMNDGSIGSTFNEGYMKVEDETAYCIDINTDFKNGYKTRADASSRMSADQISDVALSFMYRQLSSDMQEEYVSLLTVFENLEALYICRNVITVYPDCKSMIDVARQKLMNDPTFKHLSEDCQEYYFDFEAYASHLQEHGKFLVTEHGIFELPE